MAKEKEKVSGGGGGKGKGGRGWQWTQEHPPPAFKVTICCEYCGKRNQAASNRRKKQKDDKKYQEDCMHNSKDNLSTLSQVRSLF